MSINPELLKILVCPETKLPLSLADQAKLDSLNSEIKAGKLKNKAGVIVKETLDAALLRNDGKVAYAVRQDIPIMLVDEGIVL